MEWNGVQIGQRFFQRANALHPNEDRAQYDEILARQDLYYECYMTAFSREEFSKMLAKAMNGDIDLPKESDDVNPEKFRQVDADRYRRAFKQEAEVIFTEFFGNKN
jgi:hypothetical protein